MPQLRFCRIIPACIHLIEFGTDSSAFTRNKYREDIYSQYEDWWLDEINGIYLLNLYWLMDLEYVGETHQLIQLNEESFITIDIETAEQFNYYAKPRVNRDSIKNMLVGRWVSSYSKMDSRMTSMVL